MYSRNETWFIILIGAIALIERSDHPDEANSHRGVTIACGAGAAAMSEITLCLFRMYHKEMKHEVDCADFIMDAVAAPVLGIGGMLLEQVLFLLGWNKEEENFNHSSENNVTADSNSSLVVSDTEVYYTAWVSNSSLAVICTLVLRHLLKKAFLSTSHAVPEQNNEEDFLINMKEKEERKSSSFSRGVKRQPLNREENTPLLSSSRGRSSREQGKKSCCAQITDYCSSLFKKRPWGRCVIRPSEAIHATKYHLN